jgi:hypothetical protein
VKYELDAGNVAYAADKAASVRQLHRTNATVPHAGGEVRDPRSPFTQIAGLLTLSHGWSSLEPKLREHVEPCVGDRALDLVLCLQGGLLESRALPPDEPTSFETGPSSFVLFLYSLLHRLQRLATVPAVDWRDYRARVRTQRTPSGGEP